MRTRLLIAAAIVPISLGVVPAQDARRQQAEAVVGCILTQHRAVTALAGLGLKPGQMAEVAVNFGSIANLSPSDPEDVQVLFLSPDRMRGWLALGYYRAAGGITVAPNGYRLARSGGNWSASEGNGGGFTYPAVASHVDRMNRTPPVRIQLMPRPNPQCRLQSVNLAQSTSQAK
jgi:hypothetical protein